MRGGDSPVSKDALTERTACSLQAIWHLMAPSGVAMMEQEPVALSVQPLQLSAWARQPELLAWQRWLALPELPAWLVLSVCWQQGWW